MGHNHSHNNKGSKNILTAFLLNFIFAIIELIGGFYTNSVAIISDAIHDFGDSLALLFSYYAERISTKQSDDEFTFGYRRFSILSALVNGLILLFGSIYIIFEAVKRFQNPEPVDPDGMLLLAILGIIVNSIAAFKLSKDDGLNSRMVMYHLLEDIFGWVAVLIVSIVLQFKPWYILDSILSILISIIILRGVYKNIVKTVMIFLQKFPDDLEIDKLKEEIMAIDKVLDVHEIKGWSLDDRHHYLRFHIALPEQTVLKEIDELKLEIKKILKRYNVETSTIEFESEHP